MNPFGYINSWMAQVFAVPPFIAFICSIWR